MEIKKFENFEYPKGWVNIKVDDEIIKRMSRYIPALDNLVKSRRDHYNLKKKVEILSKVDQYIENSNMTVQEKISIITILQYLNEIVNNFNPSSAGFLFEHFLAALIHGNKDSDHYSKVDITTSYSDIEPARFSVRDKNYKNATYQIKLYKKGDALKYGGNIKISMSGSLCDYYVLCLKDSSGSIDIHILSGRHSDVDRDYYILNDEYLAKERNVDAGIYRIGKNNERYILINTNKLKKNKEMVNLPINNIDSLIKKCGDNVKESIELVYNGLSELHYDIDSLISGIGKNNEPIGIEMAVKKSNSTLTKLRKSIKNINFDENKNPS